MSNYKVPVINVKLIFNHDNDPIIIIQQNDDNDSASELEDNHNRIQPLHKIPQHMTLQDHQDATYRWQQYAYENQQAMPFNKR